MEPRDSSIAKIFESQASSLFEASPVDRELERKALRKLDYTILPVMAMFYFLSFFVSTICTLLLVKPLTVTRKDRANIGLLIPPRGIFGLNFVISNWP